jgi:hypothetical protein
MKERIHPTRDGYVVRFGRDISKWFRDQSDAERFLTGLRYETDKGTFDPRDYARDKPLSFSNISDQYLKHKQQIVRPRSYANRTITLSTRKRPGSTATSKPSATQRSKTSSRRRRSARRPGPICDHAYTTSGLGYSNAV